MILTVGSGGESAKIVQTSAGTATCTVAPRVTDVLMGWCARRGPSGLKFEDEVGPAKHAGVVMPTIVFGVALGGDRAVDVAPLPRSPQ